jgi:hypothetical protein
MIPRSAEKIISDLGFRASWCEKIVLMNIAKLEEMAAQDLVPADVLRKQIADLAADTRKDLQELQINAVERLLIMNRGEPAEVLTFATSEKLPRPGLVPA